MRVEVICGYPFVGHVDQEKRPVIENPIEFLKSKFISPHSFGTNELIRNGNYKLQGYLYDFKPYLKNFLYKQYGSWYEAYAPNKTMLRACIYGRIDKIVEIKD